MMKQKPNKIAAEQYSPLSSAQIRETLIEEVDSDHLPILANATLSDAEWTRPYFEMSLPTDLPSPVTLPPPASNLAAVEEGPHTIHQLLLVLNYLFVSAMLPEDNGALWCIIHRCERDWEKSLVLQYDRQLWWLVSARNALTQAEDLHCMSLEDVELQIAYLLFILGQHASPTLGFFHTYQRPYPPYRPFGPSKRRAFQLEEIRVASTKPQAICIGNDPDRMEYYRRAFLSLDPMLLPRILTTALAMEPKLEVRTNDLATLLAGAFHESYPMEDLEAAFKKVPAILQSKSDRIIVTEMFHVKAFEQEYRRGYLDGASHVLVFHVSLRSGS
ncbi:hypothetical protein N7486_005884 [Penicillium sp. IBT 16267x]|nr:hypothetical protein N7486_005884 [Penicillium sp. IBT 16267x]